MSTASPLSLPPLPPSTLPEVETRALKQQVTHRLREHRQRRAQTSPPQPVLPMEGLTPAPRRNRVADSVAARFARSISYREFLRTEAEAAVHQAEAAAEVARRNAEAIASARQDLLHEMEQWNASQESGTSKGGSLLFPERLDAEPVGVPQAAASFVQSDCADTRTSSAVMTPADLVPIATLAQRLETQTVQAEPAMPIPANLIEFPRQLVAARRARPRLAEGPLREDADAAPERAQLRIFEVEANTVSITSLPASVLPEWHTIRLDANDAPHVAENIDAQTSLALPVFVAPVPLRAMAALVDGCCIATAFLMAVAVAAYASPVLPEGIYAAAAATGSLLAFTLLYLLLFFTVNDATPGMRYARIGFCTFADENPTRASIRRRIFALLLATLPLGLGLVWACMDEDGLGWHDRISRMYPRAY